MMMQETSERTTVGRIWAHPIFPRVPTTKCFSEVVLMILVQQISELFELIRSLFSL